MSVLVINTSPSGDSGNTALILDPFLGGMSDAAESNGAVSRAMIRNRI